MYDPPHTIHFCLPHTDCFLFWPILIDLAWECVTGRLRDLQAMHIWIHVTIYFFGAAYRLLSFLTDHFFCCVSFVFLRVRVVIWDSWSFLRWWHQRKLCEKDTCCSLCSWLFWMCVTCKCRSVRLSISSLGRSFARWSCWMKAGYCFVGQSQLKYCAKCSTSPKTSSRTGMISTQSLQDQQHSATRPCWFQWCTCHGSSVMTLTWSGTSITQCLGPTPKRYDVKQLEQIVFICMYLYMCIVTYIHINTEIQTHTWIHTQMSVWIYIYRYIHTSVCVHMSKYTRWECDKYETLPDSMVVHVELGSYAIVNHIHTHTHTHTTNTYMFESRYCSGKWVHTTLWGSIGVGSSPVLINKHDQCI